MVNYIQPYMSIILHFSSEVGLGAEFSAALSPASFSQASTYHLYYLFQEFGDSARARKLYEQDSDDDDEDGELEPNPKLEAGEMVQSANGGTDRTPEYTRKEIIHNSHFPLCRSGNDLPRRFGDFPQEFVSTPICDIDPYYSDKRTFIVISKGGCIYRFSAEKAM